MGDNGIFLVSIRSLYWIKTALDVDKLRTITSYYKIC